MRQTPGHPVSVDMLDWGGGGTQELGKRWLQQAYRIHVSWDLEAVTSVMPAFFLVCLASNYQN